jgi:hypothetical protein
VRLTVQPARADTRAALIAREPGEVMVARYIIPLSPVFRTGYGGAVCSMLIKKSRYLDKNDMQKPYRSN